VAIPISIAERLKKVKIFYLEYNNESFDVENLEADMKFYLKRKLNNLSEILISGTGYIEKNGDTTTINLPRIMNGKERNILEVLSKVQGVKILADGSISYNKKIISHVLINGIKVFDGEYNTVLNRLKPDNMVKVQFIEYYQRNTNSRKKAENLTAMNLAYSSQYVLSGGVTIGAGHEDTKVVDIDLVQASKKLVSYTAARANDYGDGYYEEINTDKPDEILLVPYNLRQLSYLETAISESRYRLDQNRSGAFRNQTTFKVSKRSEFHLKTQLISEELDRAYLSENIFQIEDTTVNRSMTENQDLAHKYIFNQLEYLYKDQQQVFEASLEFSYQDYNRVTTGLLNEIGYSEQFSIYRPTLYLSSQYEYTISKDQILALKFYATDKSEVKNIKRDTTSFDIGESFDLQTVMIKSDLLIAVRDSVYFNPFVNVAFINTDISQTRMDGASLVTAQELMLSGNIGGKFEKTSGRFQYELKAGAYLNKIYNNNESTSSLSPMIEVKASYNWNSVQKLRWELSHTPFL
jgi:hypothetical protein